MRRIRAFALTGALVVGSVVAVPTTAVAADRCPTCVIERPICREEVPKVVRVLAGCFSGDPT